MKLNTQLTNLALIGCTLMPVVIPLVMVTPRAIAQEQKPVVPLLQEVLQQLRQTTSLPILLPSELPADSQELYAQGGGEDSSYYVEIGYSPNCSDSACFLGTFMASMEDYGEDGNPITLANGVQGYYLERTCDRCGDTSLTWKQNGVSYLIRYKLSAPTSKEMLVQMMRMANSAIQAGSR
ncbi:hypothetical protein H6G33_16105 [Calothrix sp. FACHB-1219]|uniref:hypothetical protein n=1 Tax=unclassified Calothrix TaxID=2619626 RepID=UPI001687BA2C|nr:MULTISPECIES: hypothetical protein [unclassified Calothrix]MBD2205428.1 hypothetical protein [Calothrix sp. FACHB-168]MBD2218559.1 hypothetical protein [Calothrix sp. FACHB-1219]